MYKYYESGTYLLDSHPAIVMFDSGATHSFVSRTFINRLGRDVLTFIGVVPLNSRELNFPLI
ncbi:hypothetical protein E9993_23125 [Labilibacter sediminis]|nr:hypothetical protein E9993_23125 [Labilibacter sediminis]